MIALFWDEASQDGLAGSEKQQRQTANSLRVAKHRSQREPDTARELKAD